MCGCCADLDCGQQHESEKTPLPQSTPSHRGEGNTGTERAGKGPRGDVAVLAVIPNFAGWGEGTALPFRPSGIPTSALNKY